MIGTAPTTEALSGIWLLVHGDTLLRFGADGTFVINNGEPLTVDPDRTGTFSLDGTTLSFLQDDQPDCPSGSVDVWTATLTGDGMLHARIEESPCPPGPGTEGDWVRLSPDSVLDRDVTAGTGSPTIASEGNVAGHVWIVDATSTLISLNEDGSYGWDDQGLLDTTPADGGRWEVAAGTLRLTSGPASTRCAEGDVLILSDGEVFQPADASFLRAWRATASGDPCRRLDGEVVLTLVA